MDLIRKRRRYLLITGSFFLAFYVLPNIINFRERRFFDDKDRIKTAKQLSVQHHDSIQLMPGEYYKSGNLYTFFFGEKNRELWTIPVYFSIFNYDTVKGGLQPFEIGGSQQTISIRLKDSSGKNWALRSVNKDQRNVLPWWLRASLLRSVFRDQVSSMNPYGAKVVASLSASLGIPHTNPEIYWVPFVDKYDKYNERIAGRIVYLEQHLDSSWKHHPSFFNALNMVNTDEMEELSEKQKIQVDTLLYLKTRLFDMLINDWDRHKDQWRWALTDSNGRKMFKPIPKDRDMAFYVFDEGIINKLVLRANNKFQSFRNNFDNIKGLMHQSHEMDQKILGGMPKQIFISIANDIISKLDAASVTKAFSQYPAAIYQKFGKQHEEILMSRLSALPSVAEKFYELVNKN